MTTADIAARLAAFARRFDERFEEMLRSDGDVPPTLRQAVRYAALGPGKRLRPYLVIRACELVGGDVSQAWPVAAAVECIHAFSLVHDDLPVMDDDDTRRGRPSCHKRFNEAIAVLAGDALVMLAFEFLARGGRRRGDAGRSSTEHGRFPVETGRLVLELARGTGWTGMIGGQIDDMEGESRPPSLALVRSIHERKTGRLFEAACRLGAIAGGGVEAAVDALGCFGHSLGCAFQIADDLLDVTATAVTAGKGVGKDARAAKQTYLRCNVDGAGRSEAEKAVENAVGQLERFGDRADDLRELAAFVLTRIH